MWSKTFPIVLFASSIVFCQTFKSTNEWDGIQSLVNAINNHNKVYLKERNRNSDWLEEENDSLSAPFDDLTGNDVGSETDSADMVKRQLISSELNILRNMKLELENDMTHKKKPIKLKPDNLENRSLGNFEMERRETLVTLPNSETEENKSNKEVNVESKNYKELLDVLAKQLYVVENFVDFMKEEKTARRQGKSEFDEILESIKNKTFVIKTTTEATTLQSTQVAMVTLIDESDIRNALKNDPLVKRIIKLAKKKRGQYMKDLEEVFA